MLVKVTNVTNAPPHQIHAPFTPYVIMVFACATLWQHIHQIETFEDDLVKQASPGKTTKIAQHSSATPKPAVCFLIVSDTLPAVHLLTLP